MQTPKLPVMNASTRQVIRAGHEKKKSAATAITWTAPIHETIGQLKPNSRNGRRARMYEETICSSAAPFSASLTSIAVPLGSTAWRLARLWEPLEVTVDIGGDSFRIVNQV